MQRKGPGSSKAGFGSAHKSIDGARTISFAEILPGLRFEAVLNPSRPGALQFHVLKSNRFYTTSQIHYQDRIYFPPSPGEGLTRAVLFPPPSAAFDSPEKLTSSVAEFLLEFGKTTREDANLLAAFAISTWFVDCFRTAPVLHLTGAPARVGLIMRLLGCVCRRPVLLGRLDMSVLRTLPKGLEATLLIQDDKLPKSIVGILDASRNRDLKLPLGKGWIHAYGSRVFFSDPATLDAAAIRIHLPFVRDVLPPLKDDIERTMTADFQAKLLRYRFVQYDAVRNSNFDSSAFSPTMRDAAHALMSPQIVSDDLRESILSSLLSRNKECDGARFTDFDCVVIEAALAFSHDAAFSSVLVKQVADAANAILRGRHEDLTMSNKAAGQVMRGLGLFSTRVTKGYRLALTHRNREKIHRLAKEYSVPSLDALMKRCSHCDPRDPKQVGSEKCGL